MKKNQILKLLPKIKQFRKELKKKRKQGEKLILEANELEDIVSALDGVCVYNNFPIRIKRYAGGTEITSGCDEVKRSAYIKKTNVGYKFEVTTYRNDGSDIDGMPVEGSFGKATALKIGKNFVTTGQIS